MLATTARGKNSIKLRQLHHLCSHHQETPFDGNSDENFLLFNLLWACEHPSHLHGEMEFIKHVWVIAVTAHHIPWMYEIIIKKFNIHNAKSQKLFVWKPSNVNLSAPPKLYYIFIDSLWQPRNGRTCCEFGGLETFPSDKAFRGSKLT